MVNFGDSVTKSIGDDAEQFSALADKIGGGAHDARDKAEDAVGSVNSSKAMALGLAGAIAGAVSRFRHARPGENRLVEACKGAALGAGSGSLASLSSDAIARDGGGVLAAATGGASAGLASMIKPGGPSALSAGLSGAGIAGGTNLVHDYMVSHGGDAEALRGLGDIGAGAAVGHGYQGGLAGLGLGGLAGGAVASSGSMMDYVQGKLGMSASEAVSTGVDDKQASVAEAASSPAVDSDSRETSREKDDGGFSLG